MRKAVVSPVYESQNVIVTNFWEYIEMWIMNAAGRSIPKTKATKALFFWKQAASFYYAAGTLDNYSKPLLQYYCILNATKTLLECKSLKYKTFHGVTGWDKNTHKISLSTEIVRIKGEGVMPALMSYFGDRTGQTSTFNLKDLMMNVPFIHRAFNLTYKSSSNLFLPVRETYFVKQDKGKRSWLSFRFVYTDKTKHFMSKVPSFWEENPHSGGYFRPKNAYFTSNQSLNESQRAQFDNYYYEVRKKFSFISGNETLWYLKRDNLGGITTFSDLVVMFAVSHRLSELARYSPDLLRRHFKKKHNWLLSEYLNNVLYQFCDNISAEICGHDLVLPSIREK